MSLPRQATLKEKGKKKERGKEKAPVKVARSEFKNQRKQIE